MEDDLNFFQMEDDLKKMKMEDDLIFLENLRRPHFFGNGRRSQVIFQMEEDLNFFEN